MFMVYFTSSLICPSPPSPHTPTRRFLGTLKQHTIQGSVPGDEDLNVEHLQLLLLLFHNLSEDGRHMVLTLVAQAIAEVAQNGESQLKAVPLNLARLLLVFDYMMHHYSKPPLYLFEQVGWTPGGGAVPLGEHPCKECTLCLHNNAF